MLVFELDHDDVAAAMNLVRGDDRQDFVVPVVVACEELRIVGADVHPRLELEPDRVTAGVPLRADVRARADGGDISRAPLPYQERAEIVVAREVAFVFARLVEVPEGVGSGRC